MGYPIYDAAPGQIVYRRCAPTAVGVILKVTPKKFFSDITVHWFQKYKDTPAGAVEVLSANQLANFERLAEDTMKKAKNHMKRLTDAQKAAAEL